MSLLDSENRDVRRLCQFRSHLAELAHRPLQEDMLVLRQFWVTGKVDGPQVNDMQKSCMRA